VLAVQLRLIWELETAVAERLVAGSGAGVGVTNGEGVAVGVDVGVGVTAGVGVGIAVGNGVAAPYTPSSNTECP